VLLASCGGGSGGNATPTRNLHPDDPAFDYLVARPLSFPAASAEDCPVTESRLLTPALPAVLGDGPVYPAGLASSTLRISIPPAGGDWPGAPVPWLAQPGFAGKILIRGGRLDKQGQVGFDYSPVVPVEPTSDRLQFDTEDTSPDPNGWWQWQSYVRVREPGCYAFQIDTDAATGLIVFRAIEQG
jgi:hypothetical protein